MLLDRGNSNVEQRNVTCCRKGPKAQGQPGCKEQCPDTPLDFLHKSLGKSVILRNTRLRLCVRSTKLFTRLDVLLGIIRGKSSNPRVGYVEVEGINGLTFSLFVTVAGTCPNLVKMSRMQKR